MSGTKRGKIAVVGAGVAGLTAAWLLHRKYHVDLYERNAYFGGHTRTIQVEEGPDAGTPVDTGFIVMNHRNYPLFTRLLEELDVPLRDSNMSFSFTDEATGYTYAGHGLNALFARRANLVSFSHWRMLKEVLSFNRTATDDLAGNRLNGETLSDYVKAGGFGPAFTQNYLFPMGAAIWSAPSAEMAKFPAKAFLQFFNNHGLLTLNDRPQWRYVHGGSRTYVKKIIADLCSQAWVSRPVQSIRRNTADVTLKTADGEFAYDHVVLASHADESLSLLANPTEEENRLLGAWSYQANEAALHTDPGLMSPHKRAWASWNVTREKGQQEVDPVSVTYHMNRLQHLDTEKPYFVTLNRTTRIREERVLDVTSFTHPVYTPESMATQASLPELNGVKRTHFCGSYFGYGFHEDAVRSAVQVAEGLGVSL